MSRRTANRLRDSVEQIFELEYRAHTASATSRQRVEPYRVLYGNRVLLVGPNYWADEPRLWRLDRVPDARILEQTYDDNPGFDLRSHADVECAGRPHERPDRRRVWCGEP